MAVTHAWGSGGGGQQAAVLAVPWTPVLLSRGLGFPRRVFPAPLPSIRVSEVPRAAESEALRPLSEVLRGAPFATQVQAGSGLERKDAGLFSGPRRPRWTASPSLRLGAKGRASPASERLLRLLPHAGLQVQAGGPALDLRPTGTQLLGALPWPEGLKASSSEPWSPLPGRSGQWFWRSTSWSPLPQGRPPESLPGATSPLCHGARPASGPALAPRPWPRRPVADLGSSGGGSTRQPV